MSNFLEVLSGDYYRVVIVTISIFVIIFHLIFSIITKNSLQKRKPYAWVKETISRLTMYIILDTIVIIGLLLSIPICLIDIFG